MPYEGKLNDAVSGFTFSRKPREERIATILFEILAKQGVAMPVAGLDILAVAKELSQYSVKDFAVRYGHLEDGCLVADRPTTK